jgi:1-acyl-sn-glycerol-3-phosphate acyltransferase
LSPFWSARWPVVCSPVRWSSRWIAVGGLLVAVLGYLTSRGIPPAPAPDPGLKINLNPITETWRNINFARSNRTVFLSILGISWFWLYGALFLAQFPAYAKNVLGGGESTVTLLLATFTVGIGLGSLLCERMSGKHVEIGLVPFGSIGLTLFGIDLYFASPVGLVGNGTHELLALLSIPAIWRVLFDLMMLGVFGGFFIVPLYALVQLRSAPEHRARIIAANNILNALFMVVGALGAAAAARRRAVDSGPVRPGCAAECAGRDLHLRAGAGVPAALHGLAAGQGGLSAAHRRHRTYSAPKAPALLVANHVSFADAVVIMGASPRPIRFVMDYRIFRIPVLSFIFRHCGAIPIASAKEDPVMMEKAFAEVSTALQNGELVGIFPEGGITRDGEVQVFRAGISRILAANPVPVVPLALSGLWGSYFSRVDGHAMKTRSGGACFRRLCCGPGCRWRRM